MRTRVRNCGWLGALTVLLLATSLLAAEKRERPARIGQINPNAETVEMFAAIAKGDIAVKLIPKNSTECNVLIENKTKKPLNVKLPDAFAGVPVLGQVGAPMGGARGGGGGGRGGSGRSGGGSNGGGSQGMGGGMGGMMGGGGGGGGGMWGLPPEQVGKFKVPTVCLDHGKAEPRPAVPYEIKPIESYTTKSGVRELCEMLGTGQLNQRSAQAAAWHLNNGMSWEELANKHVRRASGMTQPYFAPAELQAGMQIAASAVHTAKQREKPAKSNPKTGDSLSSSGR
jgi:hypothetical protein